MPKIKTHRGAAKRFSFTKKCISLKELGQSRFLSFKNWHLYNWCAYLLIYSPLWRISIISPVFIH